MPGYWKQLPRNNFLMLIKFSKLAKFDFDEAYQYYKNENDALANKFKSDIQKSISRIKNFPTLYPKIDDRVHKCVASKFPFTIYYLTVDDIIYILAVANHYKNPKFYTKRF